MTQEDKELLLKDLSARLPYGVCVEHTSGFRGTLHDITVYFTYNDDDTIKDYLCYTDFFGDESCKIEFFKPYLYPLSSMTEEQKEELSFNIQTIHSLLSRAFEDYEGNSGLFDDAGIAEEMCLLVAAERVFEHYTALYEELMAAGL